MDITFNDLPQAVSQLYNKLENIERLLLAQSNEPHPQADQLLTIKEAAKFLKLSVNTLYGSVSRMEIPVSKKGKRLYFSQQELTDWIKSGRKKTIAEIAVDAENYLIKKRK